MDAQYELFFAHKPAGFQVSQVFYRANISLFERLSNFRAQPGISPLRLPIQRLTEDGANSRLPGIIEIEIFPLHEPFCTSICLPPLKKEEPGVDVPIVVGILFAHRMPGSYLKM
jgi:hypothetical protein